MIDLSDDNDPMLFAVTLPNGRLVVQYMEVLTTVQEAIGLSTEPKVSDICNGIRKGCRTPEVAEGATDAHLIAAWHRMTSAVQAAGNA